jgi:hypothetical protein
MKNSNGIDLGNAEDYQDIEIHPDEAKEFEQIPGGIYTGRCVTMLQLGTQKEEFPGNADKERKKLIIGWELSEEMQVFDPAKGEQPAYIQNVYSLIINDRSTFTNHMESWTGGRINKEFNPLTMLGKPCLLTIQQKPSQKDPAKMKSRVVAISPLKKGAACPPQISPFKVLTFQRWNQDIFDSLGKWAQGLIEASPEYKAMMAGKPLAAGNKEGLFVKKNNVATQVKEPGPDAIPIFNEQGEIEGFS